MIVSKEGASTIVIEVADVFRRYGTEYLQKFSKRMPPSHRRAFKDILRCRTPVMGGRVFECNRCSRLRYSYHSCCNRSCPECYKSNNQAWLRAREKELQPISVRLSGEKMTQINHRLCLVSHRSFPIGQPITPCAISKPTNPSTVHR
jgi:hypothetical protein